MEKWLPVVGFEGIYEVNNYCQVKSLARVIIRSNGRIQHINERVLKPIKDKLKYSQVALFKDGVKTWKLVHIIGMQAFIPNQNNLPCINHKDENPENNYIHINEDGSVDPDKSNLEWCTQKYNVNYGTANERRSKNNMNHPNKSTTVLQYSLSGIFIKEFPSQGEAARQTGVSGGHICNCCQGKRKTAGGFIWRYKEAS